MNSLTQEYSRQLRKRSDCSYISIPQSKLQKTAFEDQNRKSVNLFEKYYPFFLDQQRMVDELRAAVQEQQTKAKHLSSQTPVFEENEKRDSDADSQTNPRCDGAYNVKKDENINSESVVNGNTQGENYAQINKELGFSKSNCLRSKSNRAESEIMKNTEVIQSFEEDVIECELVREECSDSEKSREDLIEYDIQYVSDTTNNDTDSQMNSFEIGIPNYQIDVEDRISSENLSPPGNFLGNSPPGLLLESELSFDSDTSPNSFNATASSIPSIINLMDSFCPNDANSAASSPSIYPNHTPSADSPGNEIGIEITKVLFNSPSDSNDELIPCEFCSSRFPTHTDLNCHLNTHRGTELFILFPESKLRSRVGRPIQKATSIQEMFSCCKCSKIFKSLRGLRYHNNWHRQQAKLNSNLSCHVCSEKFKKVLSLKNHILLHQNVTENYPYPHLETESSELSEPQTKSFDERKVQYRCFYCTLTFTNKTWMLHHLTIHKITTGCYTCPKCELNFKKKQILISHLDEKHKAFLFSHIMNQKSLRNEFVKSTHNDLSVSKNSSPLNIEPNTQGSLHNVNLPSSLPVTASFTCIYCNSQYEHKEDFSTHLLNHRVSKDNPIYRCPRCKHSYKKQNFLLIHYIKCQKKHATFEFAPSSSNLEDADVDILNYSTP